MQAMNTNDGLYRQYKHLCRSALLDRMVLLDMMRQHYPVFYFIFHFKLHRHNEEKLQNESQTRIHSFNDTHIRSIELDFRLILVWTISVFVVV